MIWCAGNEGFWDWLSNQFGFIDLLKLVDSRNRMTRFADAGLINEPEMVAANGPVADEFGLFLDQPANPNVLRWRRDYVKYALGEAAGAPEAAQRSQGLYSTQTVQGRAKYDPDSAYRYNIPPPEIYGLSSGVVGLRLFPNPKFDAKARAKWDAKKYYADPTGDPEMIRPYRVGMSCAFCHASYHPLKPPRDLMNPAWEKPERDELRVQPGAACRDIAAQSEGKADGAEPQVPILMGQSRPDVDCRRSRLFHQVLRCAAAGSCKSPRSFGPHR